MEYGMHIIDPRKGEPVKAKLAAWAFAADAATADALTTAFMVMSEDEIAEYCAQHQETAAMIATGRKESAEQEIEILRFGDWDGLTSATSGA
jgi:thiamine biosynthesis lipoprotein ApbE